MMQSVSRRQVTLGLSSLAASVAMPGRGRSAPAEDGRVAILDMSENAGGLVDRLKARGVSVIARYYARDFQPQLPQKRLAFNRSGDAPESKVLTDNGVAILSIYQYRNQQPEKFITGLPDTGSAAAEARADAVAALEQARMVGQPHGSAIYFGVDFNVKEESRDQRGKPVIDSIVDYFRIVTGTIGNAYRTGVYGNGYVNRVLRERDLVTFSWISASRSFAETPAFISAGKWHLFQNQVNRVWFAGAQCPGGTGLDTNVQNPAYADIGAWGATQVSPARTRTIFDQRRFVLKTATVYPVRDVAAQPIAKARCVLDSAARRWVSIPENRIERANNVRVLSDDGSWAEVDIDDDGQADGYCLTENLTGDFRTMPVL
jgi:Rv2525c-like, glycoside hydrolase-like domain